MRRFNLSHLRHRPLRIVAAVVLVAFAVFALFFALLHGPETLEEHEVHGNFYYTCSMHPQIVREEPGSCPICGMDLIKKERPGVVDHSAHTGVAAQVTEDPQLIRIAVSPRQRVLANIATVPVGTGALNTRLETVGRIAFAESEVRTISSTAAGRVEASSVNFTGQTVGRGQALVRIYSPELLTAAEEYLSSLRLRAASTGEGTRGRAEALVAASEQRLRLLGLTGAQIQSIATNGTAGTSTVVTAPFAGTVIQRLVQPGQYVSQGQPLFTVAPLGQVWVLADVYEQDLPLVRVGSTLSVSSPSLPGRRLTAQVSFVNPTVDPATRTATVRASISSQNGVLKPGMFVQVEVLGATPAGTSGIVVPASAVFETGRGAVVWVEVSPNTFEPRTVVLGNRSTDRIEVLSGLKEGDKVAVTGAFLLDSEAQLQAGASGHAH